MSSHILVDWPRTRVYADEQQGMLWINVAGRDPQGVVAPGAEYDALVAELVAQLKDLRDPLTSRPAFSEIYRRDEIYTGPMASLASDLLVSPSTDPPYQLLPSPLATRGEVVVSLEEINTGLPILRGTHRQMGMLAAWGEGVRAGTGELSGLKLMDLAPTILYALGCPLPRDMDGRPLSELFKRPGKLSYEESDVRAQVPPDRDLESEDKSLVLERLRGLGYID